ncbi:MAG: GNAT family N-acetyltransferase [Gemmatimonadota bacterium]
MAESARRRGVGRDLGEAILERLRSDGYKSAIGVVALPNPASEGLMKALGFRPVGIIRDAGFKLDRWWDVALWQRLLR